MIKFKFKKVIPDLEGLIQSIKLNLKKSFQIFKYYYKWSKFNWKSHSRSGRTFTNDQMYIKKIIPDLELILQMIKIKLKKLSWSRKN